MKEQHLWFFESLKEVLIIPSVLKNKDMHKMGI